MKRTLLLVAAAALVLSAHARILRVNNILSGSAPYQTIEAAIEAASEGDTIMLDASAKSYGKVDINKHVVLLGPGYWLTKNGITKEGASHARIDDGSQITASGAIVKGMYVDGTLQVRAEKVVVSRCLVRTRIQLYGAHNSIIHQNFTSVQSDQYDKSWYVQVTNNIIWGNINGLVSSYIAYNTIYVNDTYNLYSCHDCTIEHNWSQVELWRYSATEQPNNLSDNYVSDTYAALGFSVSMTHLDDGMDGNFAAVEADAALRSTYGAFAGATPYVLSGVPAGPVVQQLTVPNSVEKGDQLQVTITVGLQL